MPENPFRMMFKKIWYRQMLRSGGPSRKAAEEFFIKDSIDPLKFRENYAYYMGLRGRYAKYETTPSCFRQPLDLPLPFPRWFGAAYPDVVRHLSTMGDTEFTSLLEQMGITAEELRDYANPKVWEIGEQELHHFSLEVLHMLKEGYKQLYPKSRLECQ